MMINFDLEMTLNELWFPGIYGMEDDIISFSYVDLLRFRSHNYLLVKVGGCPSCVNTTPKPFPEASHSKTNYLMKLGIAKTGVIHMVSLNMRMFVPRLQSN